MYRLLYLKLIALSKSRKKNISSLFLDMKSLILRVNSADLN